MITKVLEERVEVAALKGDYQCGFHDPDQAVFRTRQGLDREIVEHVSAMQDEPAWMCNSRLKAFDIFLQKPMPAWRGNVDKMNFNDTYDDVKPSDHEGCTWDDVPENIKKTFDRLSIPDGRLGGLGRQRGTPFMRSMPC